jgi:hypothetical protein
MTWKRMSITIFLLIVLLNILQINIFLLFVFNSQPSGDSQGGFGSDTISAIWMAELILGAIMLIVGVVYFLYSRKKEKTTDSLHSGGMKTGNVSLEITSGFNHISPYYKVDIHNKTSMPIIDVTITPSMSVPSFELDKSEKKIPLIRSNGNRAMKFLLKPNSGEPGEAEMKGFVKFLNLEIDDYEEIPMEPTTVKIKWPNLSKGEMKMGQWDNVCDSLLSANEEIKELPTSGRDTARFLKRIANKRNIHIVSQETKEHPYSSIIKLHAKDDLGLNYCALLEVNSSVKNEPPSDLSINVFGDNQEVLAGFYYTIFNDLESSLEKDRRKDVETEKAPSRKPTLTPERSLKVMEGMGIQRDIFNEFDRLRERVETIEKDKIGVDSSYTSLYELDELYKILAEDLVNRRIVDVKAGEEVVKKRLEKKYLNELKRFDEAYALLCEAETSDNLLMRKDFPDSGKKAILLVYFNALEVYIREKLKELVPRGVTILLGENHGHINTRKKDWEKSWGVLGLGSCIHIVNRNKYIFLRNENLWKQKVETLMHQVREMRNVVAHPSKENPDPKLVRIKVYQLFTLLPEALKTKQ